MAECPFCGEKASHVVKPEFAMSWADLFGKPPKSFFASKVAIHRGTGDDGETMLFVHTESDLTETR